MKRGILPQKHSNIDQIRDIKQNMSIRSKSGKDKNLFLSDGQPEIYILIKLELVYQVFAAMVTFLPFEENILKN